MRPLRPMFIVLAFLVAATALFGCSSAAAPSDRPAAAAASAVAKPPEFVLKEGHATATEHPYTLGANKFAELISQRTGGRVKIDVFDNGQLGSERDVVEGLQLGTVDLTVASTGPLGGFVPEINVVDLPFLFRDKPHAYRVLDGPVGQELLKRFTDKGIVGLAVWENGFRNITNARRPINAPADLKGLKIRVMENRVHLSTFRALGADPTPMAWGEVFTALQQGVLDAQENPLPVIYTSKLYEVQKYLAMTGHFYSPAPWLMSMKAWVRLPADIQRIFADTALEVAAYERQQVQAQEDQQLALLKEKGMQVTTPDKKAFQDAAQPVYAEFEGQFGKDRIQAIVDTR